MKMHLDEFRDIINKKIFAYREYTVYVFFHVKHIFVNGPMYKQGLRSYRTYFFIFVSGLFDETGREI